jgi:hypothetical protein
VWEVVVCGALTGAATRGARPCDAFTGAGVEARDCVEERETDGVDTWG